MDGKVNPRAGQNIRTRKPDPNPTRNIRTEPKSVIEKYPNGSRDLNLKIRKPQKSEPNPKNPNRTRKIRIGLASSSYDQSNKYTKPEPNPNPNRTRSEIIKYPNGTSTPKLEKTEPNPNRISECQLKPPKIQVFINFRGVQLRNNFVGYLVNALQRSEINVFIDNHEQRGEDLNTLFKRIEGSGIAIVVFSSMYTESKWCLDELVKIKERVDQGLLKVLPIFYKVTPDNVKKLKGVFGDHFRDKEYKYKYDELMIKRWKEAIMFVSHKFALTLDEKSNVAEFEFVETIVKEVLKMLPAISKVKR